jgi:hypothetical protein
MARKKAPDPTSAPPPENIAPVPPKKEWPHILDILHKGIWPFLALVVAIVSLCISVYLNVSNQRMQRELEGLKEQFKAESQRADEEEQHTQAIREGICDLPFPDLVKTNNPETDAKMALSLSRWRATYKSKVQALDEKRIGKEKAKELWDRAEKKAKEKVDGKQIDWKDL